MTQGFQASGVTFSSEAVDGMRVIDRLSYLAVLTELGEREPGRVPPWLSSKNVTCPRCGRTDYGNVRQEDLVMCSLCLMADAIRAERQGRTSPWLHPEQHKTFQESPGFRLRLRSNRASKTRICEKCKEPFRGLSNRQRFCSRCQGAAKNDRNRAWMQEFRSGGEKTSLVDV